MLVGFVEDLDDLLFHEPAPLFDNEDVADLPGQLLVVVQRALGGNLEQLGWHKLSDEQLRAVGLSASKVKYGRALATDIVEGRIDFAALDALTRRKMQEE